MALALLVTTLAVLSASHSLAAAAPNALSARQDTANCTSASFTIPSWYINEFKSSETNASFTVQNRASGSSTSLICNPATSSAGTAWLCGSTDPSLQVSIQIKDAKAGVEIHQSWSCSDRSPGHPLAFQASGKSTIPLSCTGEACKSSNPIDLVKGSLSAPLELNPSYASGPLGHDKTGCGAISTKPKWTVGTVIYVNETGDGQNAVATHSIQFQVLNQANGNVAGCLNYFDVPENEDPAVVMNCAGGTDFTRRDRYSIRTQTVFYPRSWTLTINETWFCDDVDAARPASYTGAAKTKLPLKCTSSNGRTACQLDTFDIDGSLDEKTDLVPYSIEDPLPTPDGCTISSVVNPSWTLSNVEITKPPASSAGSGSGSVAFNMKLNTQANLFDFPVFVNNRDVVFGSAADADAWYPCSFGTGEQPLAPRNCSLRYVARTNTLAVDAEWACTDLDGDNPIVFSGVATTTLPELQCVRTAAGLERCSSKEGVSWTAEVADVKWRTVHTPVLV